MKKIILLFAFVFASTMIVAQDNPDLKLNKETNLIEATYFHENGEVSQEGTFNLDKKLHGKWISYNDAGEKISIGSYTNGQKTGKWTFWSGENTKQVEYNKNVIASVDGIKKQAPVTKN